MNIHQYIEQQQSTGQHCYALADGAVINNLLEKLYDTEGNPTFYPIYKETVLEAVLEKTPCLVAIKSNSPFLTYLLQEPTEEESWVILFSQHSLSTLVNHWQSLLYTTIPDNGKEVLFFAYRSRVFKQLMAGSSELEKSQLLGPIEQILTLDSAGTEIDGWHIWHNTEAWNGQIPEERPWYNLSDKQWQHLQTIHHKKVVKTIFIRLVQENKNFALTSETQLIALIKYWLKKAESYQIFNTEQVIKLIQVMTEFGEHLPDETFAQMENNLLLNEQLSAQEKINYLENYAALVYEHPNYPINPMRCLAYDKIYQYTKINRRAIDPFNDSDSNLRLIFMQAYQELLPYREQAYQGMQAMYQYYGNQLIDRERHYLAISYFSDRDTTYRNTLYHYFNQLVESHV
ncbi:DUF4123 domain-containing protein [Spartinivicinus ruber]|uniref:DUF4123 domain-containing protein n=1 Tax=Spartinivicinus ruber TaxID=2683272 RepID=UPI0013D16256|nr:DUF4123 domain-containing protein [Spartinivicinus ruber]